MSATIRVPASVYRRARTHLLGEAGDERYGFFLAGVKAVPHRISLLAREFVAVREEQVHISEDGFELPPSSWLPIRNRAHAENAALIEAHSHPLGPAGFSLTDEKWSEAFAGYMLDDLPGRPYAATVWSPESVDGRLWHAAGDEWIQIDELCVLSTRVERVRAAGPEHPRQVEETNAGSLRHSRQVRALGETGQDALKATQVGIVGLGGLGSISAIQLAYAGVRRFVLVDRDAVEDTNLNRLVGAGPADVGRLKTEVTEREILRISGTEACEIQSFGELRSAPAMEVLTQVDCLVGAVDNDAARLILNELAVAYMVPYFDLGVGIEAREGTVVEAGGRVIFVSPDGPCLLCAKGYSPRIAAEELRNPEDRKRAQALGYIAGDGDPSPSVVTLNTVVSGLGMTELLAFVAGLRSPTEYVYYDMVSGGTISTVVRRNAKCVVCAYAGRGPDVHLDRYVTETENSNATN